MSSSKARFRRASVALVDCETVYDTAGVDEAVHAATMALFRAQDRLRNSLSCDYLVAGGSSSGAISGQGGGGLARDEEAVSEAQGYVTVLDFFQHRLRKESAVKHPTEPP